MERYHHSSSRHKSEGFHPIIILKNMNKDRQPNFVNLKKDNQIFKSQFIGFRRFQRAKVLIFCFLFLFSKA
jgi:hypothetical protein